MAGEGKRERKKGKARKGREVGRKKGEKERKNVFYKSETKYIPDFLFVRVVDKI